MNRESFVFYRSFYEAIQELPESESVKVVNAICKYALDGEVTELTGLAKSIFILVKPQLDANNRRYENGRKGGRPKKSETEEKPNDNQKETEHKPNNNLSETNPNPNVNDNVNDNANENDNNIEETSSSTKKTSSSNNSSSKRKSRKDQLVEYVQATSFADETKDILFKWVFQIGLKGNVTVAQLQDMLKNIWESCNGKESLVREAINNSYLNNWFGFFPPKSQANFSEKKFSSHLTLDKNKNPAQPNAQGSRPKLNPNVVF